MNSSRVIKGAWYASSGSKSQELLTIMHLPYTSMVLSYVLIGAGLSPAMQPVRVVLTLIAYFLGLGLSAHALNELHARHWIEALNRHELLLLFTLPLVVALLIGAYGMLVLYRAGSGSVLFPLMLLGFVGLEAFFLFAYNLQIFKGRFHSDLWFALSWAALPVLISYFVNALTISPSAIIVSAGAAATAGIEINLSRWCKDFRRKSQLTELHFKDGTVQSLSTRQLILNPEKALKLIVVAVDLMGLGLMAFRVLR